MVVIVSNYDVGEEIGSGAFGTVNIGKDRTTGEKVAIKCISKTKIQKRNMGPQVKKEINTMKKLDHPNIVRIKEVLMSNSHLYLVLEYAEGGELFSKIARHGRLSESVSKRYFKQVMEAVRFCHNLYICHRDIKPENILLDSGDNVKVADFGFASIMEPEPDPQHDSAAQLSLIQEDGEEGETLQPLREFVPDSDTPPKINKFRPLPSKKMQKLSTMCGTTQYMAPEIVNRNSYRGDKADIWSCGVVLFVVVSGYLPFDSNNPDIVVEKIKAGRFKLPPTISDLARDVITKMLTPNPLLRPGAKTILAHEWFGDATTSPSTGETRGKPPAERAVDRPPERPTRVKMGSFKLVPREKRKMVTDLAVEEAVSKVVAAMRANTWLQKRDTVSDACSSVKGSKMTSTGLAMIQVVVEKLGEASASVEVEVFGRQKNVGASEINALIEDLREISRDAP